MRMRMQRVVPVYDASFMSSYTLTAGVIRISMQIHLLALNESLGSPAAVAIRTVHLHRPSNRSYMPQCGIHVYTHAESIGQTQG